MRFSVKRLLWAFAIWSGAFALLHSDLPARNVAAVVVATSLAGVVLLVRNDHVVPIVAIALGAVVGIPAIWFVLPGIASEDMEAVEKGNIFWTCLGAFGGSLFMRLMIYRVPSRDERADPLEVERIET